MTTLMARALARLSRPAPARSERGAELVEYVVITAGVLALAILVVATVGPKVKQYLEPFT